MATCVRKVGRFWIAYRRHTADERVIAHSFDNDIYLAGVPEYTIAPDHVIIDVGAHIGTFSLLAGSLVPQGKVHAVEACHESFRYLVHNVGMNGFRNVHPSHMALASRDGSGVLFHDATTWGNTITKELSDSSEVVPMTSLPTFLDANGIPCCDFVKMNCEGAEFEIILGTPPTYLQRCRTMLVLYHCDLTAGNPQDLERHLQSAGFRTTIRERTEDRGWLIATTA